MSRIRKTIAKRIVTLFGLTVLLIGGVIVAVNVSPRPFALFVRRQFAEGIGVKPVTPAIYLELSQKVRAERDIEYPSRFKSNQLDIFSPKDSLGPFPTILWTHGGGFVGGDPMIVIPGAVKNALLANDLSFELTR